MWEFDRAKVAYRPARKAITGSSTDEYTDSSLDALYEGVLEDVHGHQNVSVLFSGGLDSSAIAWALAKAGVETHLLYMDFTSTAPLLKSEMARAVEIARRLNLPFHTIPVHLGDIEPSEVFGTAVQAPNNFLSAPGVRQAAKVAVELGSTALCMGSFGDTLWNGSHQDPFYAALRATLRGDLPTVLAWLGTQRNLSQLSRLRGIADGFRIASRLVGRSESEVVGSIDRKCTRRVAVPRLGGMYAYSLAERHLRTELDSVHLEFWQHDLMVGSLELHDPLRHPRIWASIWNLPADRRQVIIGATVVGKYEWRRLLKDYFPTTCHEGDRVGYKQLADAYLEMFGDEIRSRFRRSTLADRGVVDAKLLRRYGSSVAGFRSAHPTGILRLLGADYWLERVDRMRVS
ncbi:hypothetical protein BWI15_17610 [Kribbella sp. ALI-6-A]|uniref:asparagine synthase-related protein n=1 Tax=Kribbella sp. ALI-6-A TaxID=1933817 RepID=UPI00097C70E6|nr:asparagine synthase-related protein [Kribbella sp. ALI-6-A]ONI71933.1 hypothetical protein BWI15_17610 [Kribbella sp. ALI-6-A]